MIKLNSGKNKFFIFLIISWIIIRLKWTVEISRLTIFRIIPKSNSQMVTLNLSFIHPAVWFFENNQSSCVTFDKKNNNFVIQTLQPISNN